MITKMDEFKVRVDELEKKVASIFTESIRKPTSSSSLGRIVCKAVAT